MAFNYGRYRPNKIATDCHLFHTFFTVPEVDLIVLSALSKKLLIFVREVYTSRILVKKWGSFLCLLTCKFHHYCCSRALLRSLRKHGA